LTFRATTKVGGKDVAVIPPPVVIRVIEPKKGEPKKDLAKKDDKKGEKKKPQIFVDKGFVFVATNYRFIPNVTVAEMAGDLAKSIRYVHDHAREFGGDPNSIIVMGHSSGAHMAALICTDEQHLKAEQLPLSILKGCVPIDCSFYDIPKRIKDGGDTPIATIHSVFTDKDETHRALSPALHVARGKDIPPFLILHVAERADTKAQAHWLASLLKETGVAATVVGGVGKTHGTINSELAVVDDEPTKALFAFLEKVRK
jgi:acetyl esterase/lipase